MSKDFIIILFYFGLITLFILEILTSEYRPIGTLIAGIAWIVPVVGIAFFVHALRRFNATIEISLTDAEFWVDILFASTIAVTLFIIIHLVQFIYLLSPLIVPAIPKPLTNNYLQYYVQVRSFLTPLLAFLFLGLFSIVFLMNRVARHARLRFGKKKYGDRYPLPPLQNK